MALSFVPSPGTVLVCDFDRGRESIIPPEMTKRRPVVVVSSWRRIVLRPFLVVPLSTKRPRQQSQMHCRLPSGVYDFLRPNTDCWALCEHVTAVSGHRLDRLYHRGQFVAPHVSDEHLTEIHRGILNAMGLQDLIRER